MLFNNAKTKDFTPELVIEDKTIDIVEHLKLLGVQETSDLKQRTNTAYITKRAYNKLWVIRRLKTSGANTKELFDIYCKHVRSILEYAAVVWHSALTVQNSGDIERVQNSALAIILGNNYISYDNALETINLERLGTRRSLFCLKFAKKNI